jgi:hypothetical protein
MDKAIEILGVRPTKDTYVYLNDQMELDCMEKKDRHSAPLDEVAALGYYSAYEH